ncbi:protein NYNRIN-like [Leucoraja erinacea]|uniref:protein NYNRIN-like n=1 Tax=Leucoraja erinaceus TaxID=7782 RepID=UPI0024538944|nr:protein NYNRIN-like [Leucoraja erinacea]
MYLFGQILEQVLEDFPGHGETQLLQYVDDLLLSGAREMEVRDATISLLNFLGRKGLRVSRNKLQFVKQEVKYLGHLISGGKRRINPERIAGITRVPLPKNKKEIRKFLGLIGYCRLWIDDYSRQVKFLYDKLGEEKDKVQWTPEQEVKFGKLKNSLITAPVLALPSVEQPFHLFVNSDKGVALGVLTQKRGGNRQPVAFLSKILDPVCRGWPGCIQAVAATAILVEESRKLTFGGTLVVSTPHTVRTILTQKSNRWLTDSRLLKYEAILMEKDDLMIITDKNLNPSQFLYPAEKQGDKEEGPVHCCSEIIDLQTKSREDLEEQPLAEGSRWFIDGSTRCIDGKRHSGYGIVNGETMEEIESGRLPGSWSAQSCELYALMRALELLEGKEGTVYTDSKYAFGVVHTFGKIWKERGMITTRGKELAHEQLIGQTLEALQKPERIAIAHVAGHQKGNTLEARGNRAVDEVAKRAATEQMVEMKSLIPLREPEEKIPIFSEKEQENMKEMGAQRTSNGKWWTPNGKQLLNKEIMRELLGRLHGQSHWGTQALCDTLLRTYACCGMFTMAKQVIRGCVICQRINKKIMRAVPGGGQPLAVRPFQRIQIDFTELPRVRTWKYLLVVVDHFTRWVEAFPTATATTQVVAKILLEQIIPRYGIVETIDSDRGTHFASKTHEMICEALGIEWKLHTPWHPQSSGKVERMNGTLKTQITKLIEETRLPWTKCLPIALLRIRTAPRKDIGISPYEMLFGLPYLGKIEGVPTIQGNDVFLRNYLLAVSQSLAELKIKGLLAQSPPLDFPIHSVKAGDWVLIKTWKEEKLQPKWTGPYLVLLITETAVRTKEKGWTHASRVKGPVEAPPDDISPWTVRKGEEPLTLIFTKNPQEK